MNYIEEMMETVGVKKGYIYNYRDFTIKKQVEILRLISFEKFLSIIQYYDMGLKMYKIKCSRSNKNEPLIYHVKNDHPAQTLAQLVTELMNAGELDKQKVKEILEGWR